MRSLGAIVALLGIVALVLGVVIIVHNSHNPAMVPFAYEAYGGPGPLFAGLIMLLVGGYLFRTAPRDG